MEYKTFEELKEELGHNYDKFMYDMNLELLKQWENSYEEIRNFITDKVEAIDYIEKMLGKEASNEINPHFEVLKQTYKEILNKLEEIKEKYGRR